jgi:hypothetical protein
MKKRFIVLIDCSMYSGNLIKYAYDWSLKVKAELLLVHQTMVMVPALTDNHSKKQITQHSNDKAFQKLHELALEFIPPGTKYALSVSENPLLLTIQNRLAEPFDQLIFTGIKGTGVLKQILLGSTALQIIENTQNIVVAMPPAISSFNHEKIFIAVSHKHPINILELNKVLRFITHENTTITFFNLEKSNEKTKGMSMQLEELAHLFGERFTTKTAIYDGENPFEDIKKVINKKEDEMLIIQKGSRLLTDKLFRRFLINELVYEGQTPLIVLP